MELVKAKAKKWGNSLGIVLPRDFVLKENIKENDEVEVLLIKDNSRVFKSDFGLLKGKVKKSTQAIKDQLRRELYND